MGALFRLLYWKRGLVCSMAAHASFNGVLTVVAIFLALSPGHSVSLSGLTFQAPSGWHQSTNQTATELGYIATLIGPSSAQMTVMALPTPTGGVTTAEVVQRVESGALNNQFPAAAGFDHSTPEVGHIPAGDIVSVHL